ncbi:MAG: hypothetical protein GY838_15425 [bacterium]|nr:hypothetical protein [bacterium]
MSYLIVALFVVLLAPPASAVEEPPTTDAPVVVYYFHRTLRCQTCLAIEALARYDVTTELAAEVESGQLAWRPVDFEEPQNAAFVEEFSLVGSSLIVTRREGGEIAAWERLDRTWELHGDVETFNAYVLEAVGRFLDLASEAGDEPVE